jgi:hypothetical protein
LKAINQSNNQSTNFISSRVTSSPSQPHFP